MKKPKPETPAEARLITKLFAPLLKQILAEPHVRAYFGAPVDPVRNEAPGYFQVIARPMDLGTVQARLTRCGYLRLQDLLDDVDLTFQNALTYNRSNSLVYTVAKKMQNKFHWGSRKPALELARLLEHHS